MEFMFGFSAGIIFCKILMWIATLRLHNDQLAADTDRLERMRRNG